MGIVDLSRILRMCICLFVVFGLFVVFVCLLACLSVIIDFFVFVYLFIYLLVDLLRF